MDLLHFLVPFVSLLAPQSIAPSRRRYHEPFLGLIACGVVMTLLLGSQARVPDLLARPSSFLRPAHGYLAACGATFLLYLLSIRLARAAAARPRAVLMVIAVGALAMRLVLLTARPTLSTDYLRYLWDGRVAHHGVNPYRYPPDAPALRDLRFPGWDQINYRGTRTPYPPLAEITFWLNTLLLGDSLVGLKLLFTGCDLAAAWLLLQVLRRLGRPVSNILIYAWNPLVITETALSGHLDAQGVFLLVAALWSLCPQEDNKLSATQKQPVRRHQTSSGLAGLALGLSVAVKSFPALYLPAMARYRGGRLFWAAVAAIVALHLPVLLSGAPLQGGAQAMATYWVSNASLYPWIERFAGIVLPGRPDAARSAARLLVTMAVLLIALLAGRKRAMAPAGPGGGARFEELVRDLYLLTMTVFLLSPVVMPWYLVWLIPFLLVRPAPSGFAFTALVTLAYLIPAHRWLWWFSWVEYVPVYCLFAAEMICPRISSVE
jgi:hypothetical protein